MLIRIIKRNVNFFGFLGYEECGFEIVREMISLERLRWEGFCFVFYWDFGRRFFNECFFRCYGVVGRLVLLGYGFLFCFLILSI